MGSRKPNLTKKGLEEILAATRGFSSQLERMIDEASDYDFKRQLKKVDAELIDFQHSLAVAIDLGERKK